MTRVKKTTFEKEQEEKQKWFLELTPEERMKIMCEAREKMRKPGVKYSYEGMKVTIKRRA